MASLVPLMAFCAVATGFTLSTRKQQQQQQRKKHKKKWDLDDELECYLRSLPKVELHVHLDGSFDPLLLKSYLEATGHYDRLPESVKLPWDDSTLPIRELVQQSPDKLSFHNLCTCRGKRSLPEMLKCFEVFVPIVRGNLSLLETLAHDFVKRQAGQNIIYTEVRYSPHLLAENGSMFGEKGMVVEAEPVVEAVTRGLRRGERDYCVKVNQILCCLSWRPDWADDIIQIAHRRRNHAPCAVVGVDIAAGEEHFDQDKYPHLHEPHYTAFQKAKRYDLNVTMHAGEVGSPTYIHKAVNEYNAKRIGHGYRIIHNPQLMQQMKRNQIHFEICPTSSVETGGWDYDQDHGKNWKQHPAVIMLQNNIKISLNSDDPAVFDTSLTWQLRIAIAKMGLDKTTLNDIVRDSIDAAFLSPKEKNDLHRIITQFEEGQWEQRREDDVFAERVSGFERN